MPVCIYFEKGMCFTPNCPYLHVKVSQNAAVCPRFLKGYCPDGTACRLKHELPDPRKRARDVSAGGDHGDGDENTTLKKKTRTTSSASETGSELPHRRSREKRKRRRCRAPSRRTESTTAGSPPSSDHTAVSWVLRMEEARAASAWGHCSCPRKFVHLAALHVAC
ncbi:unnamed protein product [Ectocarpus sp. 12 AP-2014]